MGSLLDDIKNQVKKSGSNKGKFIYFKPGSKVRVRFRQDMEDGMKVVFHDSFTQGINVPCQEVFGRRCRHCDNDELRHRDQYIWSVYDVEAKEDKLLMGAVNNCSPIPLLVGFYDTYGTLVDRDYVITKNGSGTTASFSVVPMDKVKFRNEKSKAFSESKILSLLDKAFPDEGADDDDEDDEPPKKKKGKPAESKSKPKKKPVDDEDDDEDEDEAPPKKSGKSKKQKEEEEDEVTDYYDMTPRELYALCKDRDIDCKPKKEADYYIELLEEDDEGNGDEDDGDDW